MGKAGRHFQLQLKKIEGRRFCARMLLLCFGMGALWLSSCASVPAPRLEYVLAREAYDAARIVEAARYSPGHFHQGEEKYRRAQQAFDNENFSEAQKLFQSARQDFERAENSARLIRFKSGEVL